MANALPTTADLQALLTAAGLISKTPTDLQYLLDLDGALASAKTEWEKRTGWVPFLFAPAGGGSGETTRRYDPPGNKGSYILALDGGLISLTSLLVSVTVDTPAGTALTVDKDFFLQPYNAPAEGRPYEWIEFCSAVRGMPASVRVTGTFGFSASIPDDAFQALLRGAASELGPELAQALSKGQIEWKQGDESAKYGDDPLSAFINGCRSPFERGIGRYRRIDF